MRKNRLHAPAEIKETTESVYDKKPRGWSKTWQAENYSLLTYSVWRDTKVVILSYYKIDITIAGHFTLYQFNLERYF